MPYPKKGECRNTGRTHLKKGHIPWNKKPPVYIYCKLCGKKVQIKPARIKTAKFCSVSCGLSYNRKGKKLSEEHKLAIKRGKKIGEDCTFWKGNSAKHRAVHSWVVYYKGKASENKCVDCGKQARHWSNIDHKYKRDLDDYIARCYKCHFKYDRKFNNMKAGRPNKIKNIV